MHVLCAPNIQMCTIARVFNFQCVMMQPVTQPVPGQVPPQGQTIVVTPGSQVVQQPQPRTPAELDRKTSWGLGVTQLVVGIVCLLLEIIVVGVHGRGYSYFTPFYGSHFQGIWAGVFVSSV